MSPSSTLLCPSPTRTADARLPAWSRFHDHTAEFPACDCRAHRLHGLRGTGRRIAGQSLRFRPAGGCSVGTVSCVSGTGPACGACGRTVEARALSGARESSRRRHANAAHPPGRSDLYGHLRRLLHRARDDVRRIQTRGLCTRECHRAAGQHRAFPPGAIGRVHHPGHRRRAARHRLRGSARRSTHASTLLQGWYR